MGLEAEYCDSTMQVAVDKAEFLEIWKSFRFYKEKNNIQFEYDSRCAAPHLIYQNKLMEAGMNGDKRRAVASELYHVNTAKKVKDACICPSCGGEFIKASYQQKFCKSKIKGRSSCKDFFHNFVNPSRMARLNWDV